jgi:hypothetical protein
VGPRQRSVSSTVARRSQTVTMRRCPGRAITVAAHYHESKQNEQKRKRFAVVREGYAHADVTCRLSLGVSAAPRWSTARCSAFRVLRVRTEQVPPSREGHDPPPQSCRSLLQTTKFANRRARENSSRKPRPSRPSRPAALFICSRAESCGSPRRKFPRLAASGQLAESSTAP